MRIFIISAFILLYSKTATSQILSGLCSDGQMCAPHGKCMDGYQKDTYWCRCDNGYGGEFCEKECNLECEDDDEKCGFDESGQHPQCICKDCSTDGRKVCPFGYEGDNCEIQIEHLVNPCLNNPCHEGRCAPFSGGFQCICKNGFGGSYCEIGTDNCKNHLCRPGSTCVSTINDYYCACPPGRAGTFCELTNCTLLGDEICNHGKCIDKFWNDKNFICECDAGYEGEFCTQDRNECLDEGICSHRGTCQNLAGGFVCSCKNGFKGKHCQDTVDMCQEYHCKNGGDCVHLPDRTPVCQCKQGFIGHKCEQACPPGFGGYDCKLPLNRPNCSRFNGTCFNDGRCINGFCKCPPGFVGDRCERNWTSVDPYLSTSCEFNPCMNNGRCVDVGDGYACICPPGFYGPDCDGLLQCAPTTCANGGICSVGKRSLSCSCPLGFSGEYCEVRDGLDCSRKPCLNGGFCEAFDRTKGNSGFCNCPFGYTGTMCQEKLVIEKKKEVLVRDLCKQRNCDARASDGVCNPECNLEECKFDGGDCSGGQQPFSKCRYPSRCADSFANGICNQECNNEGCLYDGLDCQSELYRCPKDIREYCMKKRGDGECDYACSFVGCGFDGGDCYNETGAMILNDIRLVIQIDPIVFQETGGNTLMEISRHLRAAVRIQKDDTGPLVFHWDGEHETERLQMDTKKLSAQHVLSHHVRKYRRAEITGVVLYLEVEEICQPRSTCRFSTAQSVVNLIAAGLVKSDGRQSLGFPITEAMVATPRRNTDVGEGMSRNQILLVVVIAFFALGTVVAGVMVKAGEPERSRKRKIIHAPVWTPPMETPIDKQTPHNSSIYSSQVSLLNDSNMYLNAPKRVRREFYLPGPEEQYQEIYPRTLANGVVGEYAAGGAAHRVINMPQEPVMPEALPAEKILLHVQAAGSYSLTEAITRESVKQVDTKYGRQVLHWLAGNTNGKAEDLVTSESVSCLEAGADVNALDNEENTPLMLAVRARRVRLAVILMRHGANPTIFNKSERSCLHEACVNRDFRMVTILLTDARMLKEIDELDRNGMTALMLIAGSYGPQQVEMAKLLLVKGAKIDADGVTRKDSDKYHGRTALHYAALCDNIEMVEFLVMKNSNKDKQDEAGQTPLMLAAKEGHELTVRFLVGHGASVTMADVLDKTALQYAREGYHHEVEEFLLTWIRTERERKEAPQKPTNPEKCVNQKTGRQTMKAVKRAGSRKSPTASTPPSRDPNHLTPPPSDGSFSSPSPHYFHTTASTPTAMESSPEYVYTQDVTNSNWYPTPSSYHDLSQNMPPSSSSSGGDPLNGSFYC
ncbi:CRE-GLP-1 protein [Caenorhabditis remanei]|uniref:CRE-GLP-1 protein n=1 Tax=Caenorhabditis remanei TaxID=31234 RepID=E3NFX9_CAERE|nr:CRE-GLP-1 protein [Caenorhabditis remanei]